MNLLRDAVTMPYLQFTGVAIVLLASLLLQRGERRR